MLAVTVGIALNTWKQFVRDRVFYLAVVAAFFLLAFSYLLASLTITESRKILLDFGFSAISLAGLLMAIYLGIIAVAREIESRIIYTVVTKPVSRATYVVGKFLGAALVLAATQLLLALTIWVILRLMGEILPEGFSACMGLVFLENLIVLAFAFTCSSFTSSVLSAGLSLSFFLIGRSNATFQVLADKAESPGLKATARFLYLTMPNLERFNLRDVVAYSRPYPPEMVTNGLLYAGAYVLACVALCCLVLRARDFP